jgi:hypothetical protein
MPMKFPPVNKKAFLSYVKPSSAPTKDGHELRYAGVNPFTVERIVLITYR